MSEGRAHFRVKKGEIEIEYEGKSSEVNERYKEAFDWIKTATITPSEKKPPKEEKKIERKPKKNEEKRGGARTAVISPAIDELIKGGFLDDFNRDRQVLEELERKTIPVSGIKPVRNALNRRVPRILDRIKDKKENGFTVRKPNQDRVTCLMNYLR